MIADTRLARILVDNDIVERNIIEAAQEAIRGKKVTLYRYLLKKEIIDDEDIAGALMLSTGLTFIRIDEYNITENTLKLVPPQYCHENRCVPVSLVGDVLTIAVLDILHPDRIVEIREMTKSNLVQVLASANSLKEVLKNYRPPAGTIFHADEDHNDDDFDMLTGEQEDLESVLASVDDTYHVESPNNMVKIEGEIREESAPIVRLANRIIEEAHEQGASDIHIEPFEYHTLVRYRIDGICKETLSFAREATAALTSRIKIMAQVNITERRKPQDGRINFKQFSPKHLDIDLRVSTCPVNFGEKIVMRILDKGKSLLPLAQMGFSPSNEERYMQCIKQPYGMILHVGPTGSGKTTTLYSALSEVSTPQINIQTAEDPIEYVFPGINQVQVNKAIGFTFAVALRSFLRQDPDVILVGEIRDLETAEIAIEASLTGHLIFSTLHTNNAVGTIERFIDMGIPPWLVGSSILCICAQRLVRRLCTCKVKYTPTQAEIDLLGIRPDTIIYATGGCSRCGNTGYKGRVGIHEVLTVDGEFSNLIAKSTSSEELTRVATEKGMQSLFDDGVWKVKEGLTSIEEISRLLKSS